MSYPAGKFSLVKIQDALYNWVREEMKGVLDDDNRIIWRNQSEPLPPRPCVTLRIMDGPTPVGRSGNIQNAPNDRFNIGVQAEMTLSIQVFGNHKVNAPMAYQAASDINQSLLKDSVLERLRTENIAVQQIGHAENLTSLEESEYEERAGFSVQLGVALNVVDDPGIITEANVTGNIEGGVMPHTINVKVQN